MDGRERLALAVGLVLALCVAAQAVTIEWVTVGDASNNPDDTGYGTVDHDYRIGKYEVTCGQYREFLNAKAAVGDPYGLYNSKMTTDARGGIQRTGSGTVGDPWVYSPKGGDASWDDRPVVWVSGWDAARLANWMHNGQGSGDTETGAYANIGNQATFARQPDALIFLPSENEWYKAAYYKAGGTDAGYWEYPTQSDHQPTVQAPPGTDLVNGSANCNMELWNTTQIGAYTAKPSTSAYGTFDQGGNVWEWHETAITTSYGLRGSSWGYVPSAMAAAYRNKYLAPTYEGYAVGIRLASPAFAGDPPVADAGGAYHLLTGQSVMLDGSASADPDGSIVSWQWEIDGAAGPVETLSIATYSWAQLHALFGISSNGVYDVRVEVTDDQGLTDWSQVTTLTIAPEPTTLTLLVLGGLGLLRRRRGASQPRELA